MISDVICDTCQKLSYHNIYEGDDSVSIWTLDLYLLENNIKNSENPHSSKEIWVIPWEPCALFPGHKFFVIFLSPKKGKKFKKWVMALEPGGELYISLEAMGIFTIFDVIL